MEKSTTASGIPYFHHQGPLTADPRAPVLREDFILHEKMAYFNWERIPEWEDDHYSQPGELFKEIMNDSERQRLVENLTAAMTQISGSKRQEINGPQLCHFFRADAGLGNALANGLKTELAQMTSR
ncbi:catalase [Pedobacter panaciterrae]|uniref:catalase-related domain-containing protein n=1 Tax=Pedobacter panaciterrae TaxID=363849 RepID=UPI00155D87D5|nr:catalase-related domain-containing protein [Pedobacter panaciterrae]NQX54048.1 catalase [Pedobacter panaciterrae]